MPSNWDVLPSRCKFWDNTRSKGKAGKGSLYLCRLPFSCRGQRTAPWEGCARRLTDSWPPGSPAVPVVPQPFPSSPPAVLDERTEEKSACKFRQQTGKQQQQTIHTWTRWVRCLAVRRTKTNLIMALTIGCLLKYSLSVSDCIFWENILQTPLPPIPQHSPSPYHLL